MKFIGIFSYMCAVLLFFYSCKNNEPSHSNNNNAITFYYYPKTNVYYDVANASYIYSIDSGRTWTTLLDTSKRSPNTLGKKIIINSATSDIWMDNEVHRKLYGGTLINLVKKDTVVKIPSASARALIKKRRAIATADSIRLSAPPKKRRNFFQRLFGKKRKKQITDQPTNI